MEYLSLKEQKIELIRTMLQPLLGQKIVGYAVAEVYDEDDESWDVWHELPLRLDTGAGKLSISWEKFDDLAIAADDETDEEFEAGTIRWRNDGIEPLDLSIGQTITGVSLATYPQSSFWNRLLISLDDGKVLDIYNGLDENGYMLYESGAVEGEIEEIAAL